LGILSKSLERKTLRYFFHFVGDGTFHEDTTGEHFPTVGEAIAHARVIAAELMADDPNYDSMAVSVVDENANVVARVLVGHGDLSST
jgi:hypothetical protein